jgi:hypothetical protein
MKDQPPICFNRYQHPFGHTSGASEIILTDPIYRLQRGGERCKLDSTIPERVTTSDTDAALPILYRDNKAANKLSEHYAYHCRTRHIDHKYHYVRQEARCGNLEIMDISGKNQLADPLTKLLIK